MRRDGAEGVASGFELLSAMIDRFGTDLLPARSEMRKAALEWLAGATFADRLDRVQGLAADVLERALSALALITESTASWPPWAVLVTGGEACGYQWPEKEGFKHRSVWRAPYYLRAKSWCLHAGDTSELAVERRFLCFCFFFAVGKRNEVPPRTVANSDKENSQLKHTPNPESSNPAQTPTTRQHYQTAPLINFATTFKASLPQVGKRASAN